MALRWVGPFLPTLERAFSTTTGTLTGIMGVCELGGLSTAASGRLLDRGLERRVTVVGLAAVTASCLIALVGTVPAFAASFMLLILGMSNMTVSNHAWIGHRIPFAGRSRAIGIYETSWAVALLVGAPVLAVVISWFGWRGPYVVLATLCAGATVAVAVRLSPGVTPAAPVDGEVADRAPLPRSAWLVMTASAGTAASGLSIFVVSGAWLDDRHGVSTGGLGVVAGAFGLVELASSGSVAAFGDRIGSRRSTLAGLLVLVTGVVVMAVSGDSRAAAIAGLLAFLTGFEFAFVSSLTLVTEAAPGARGRAIGTSNALATVARSAAIVASGQLYEAVGMGGSLGLAGSTGGVAIVAVMLSWRLSRARSRPAVEPAAHR